MTAMRATVANALNEVWQSASKTVLRGFGQGATGRLLQVNPRPLIHPDARMVVLFSAKSACSSVVIWFLHQLGLAQRAREYDLWPHQYRTDIYYGSQPYRDACKLDLSGFHVVRVVRNSFDRAVSSFRHAQRAGLTDEAFARLLGRPNAAEDGVSFCEFLDLLERMDLKSCNIHYALQRHPIEDHLPVTHLINVSTENLYQRLNEIEVNLGLPVTDFDRLEWIHALDWSRHRDAGTIVTADAYNLRLTRENARRGPWPATSALLTPVAQERIARLYAEDIAAYGQPSAAIPKTQRSARPSSGGDDIRALRRAARQKRLERRAHRQVQPSD
jgi:hypothetical protein